MPPDVDSLLRFISDVILDPVRIVGAFIGALFLILFVIHLLEELIQNARAKYRR